MPSKPHASPRSHSPRSRVATANRHGGPLACLIALPASAVLIVFATALLVADNKAPTDAKSGVPNGLPAVSIPKDNQPSAAKISLGKQLYFDKRLSKDNTISCASCHDPQKGWSNGLQFGVGVGGQKGGRNSPTVLNTAYNKFQFWDGRAPTLEAQALGPIQNPIEMGMTLKKVVAKLNQIEGYRTQFRAVFGTDVTSDGIGKAIAAYERTVLTGDAPYDRFKAGDKKSLSAAAERGRKLFFNKAHCSACHAGANFTDNAFHNIGVGMDKKNYDVGRAAISKLEGDRGSFKTPTLRDIARTGPYMHDGSLKTLEAVVAHYNKGGIANPYLDEEIFALDLSKQEIQDLITFMKEGLSGRAYPAHKPPKLPK